MHRDGIDVLIDVVSILGISMICVYKQSPEGEKEEHTIPSVKKNQANIKTGLFQSFSIIFNRYGKVMCQG